MMNKLRLSLMNMLLPLLIITFSTSCESSMAKRRDVESSSEFMGKTFVTKIPLAYKMNLPRYKEVSSYIRNNSSTIFADEVDRRITRVISRCAGCMSKNRLTTPIRLSYIPIGTKLTVVDEYLRYRRSWINGPTKIHTLILKDDFGNLSEMSELSFKLDVIEKVRLRKEEVLALKHIDAFQVNQNLNLAFCIGDWVREPGEIGDFVSDFKLDQEMLFQPETLICDDGYKITFKTTEAYLTSVYYFQDWGLYGNWRNLVTNEKEIAHLKLKRKLSNLDRTDSLAGTDKDNNSIRDDIDTYIENEFKPYLDQGIITQKQFNSIEQMARAWQVAVTTYIPEDDWDLAKANAMASFHTFSDASSCLTYRFWYENHELRTKQTDQIADDALSQLSLATMNTELRIRGYLSRSKYFDERSLSLSPKKELINVCDDA